MRAQVEAAGLGEWIAIDSAGTGDWHVGEAPDDRAQRAGSRRGYDLSALRARQIAAGDFERFDLVLAMDAANLDRLRELCPPALRSRVRLLMEFGSEGGVAEVADPYFGSGEGFELVLDQCEDACRGLLAHLRAELTGETA
jgi:protein-tyrosine phosphatase